MSLFRQQALQERQLPEPSFTPVMVVSVRRGLWVTLLVSLLSMAGIWLILGRVYTTYDTTITLTGSQILLSLPADINLTSPIRAVAACPQIIHGTLLPLSNHKAVLQLDTPIEGECHITLILGEQSPLEHLFPSRLLV